MSALEQAKDAASKALSTVRGFYPPTIMELARALRETRSLETMDPEIAQIQLKHDLVNADIETLRARLVGADTDEDAAGVGNALSRLYVAATKLSETAAVLKHRRQTMLEEQAAYVERANVIAFMGTVKKGCIGILQSCMALLKKYVPAENSAEIQLWYQKQTVDLEVLLRAAVDSMVK